MARKLHGVTGEQWDLCARCGQWWPMSKLAMQKGVMLCTAHCWDNLDVEQRNRIIEQLLGQQGTDQEGSDLRYVDWNSFSGHDREEG